MLLDVSSATVCAMLFGSRLRAWLLNFRPVEETAMPGKRVSASAYEHGRETGTRTDLADTRHCRDDDLEWGTILSRIFSYLLRES